MNDQDLIALNLDTEEREESYTPFRFVIGGRPITMKDPADMDWKFLKRLDDEDDLIVEAMGEDDAAFFQEQPLPAWKMRKLSLDYQAHYGIEPEGKAG